MTGLTAEWAMISLGATSAVVLVVYGLIAFGGSSGTDPFFWVFTVLFLLYIGWDIRRHLRIIRTRSGSVGKRGH